jgi:hypothetical protein
MRPSVLIGSPEAGVWQVEFHIRAEAFGPKKKPRNLSVRVQADAGLDKVEAVGEAAADETAPQRLFMNRDGKLVEEGENRGVNARPVAAANAVAVDFDNDMDLDLFVLGTNDAGKTENLLLLNDGKGRFKVRQRGRRRGRPGTGWGIPSPRRTRTATAARTCLPPAAPAWAAAWACLRTTAATSCSATSAPPATTGS